MEEELSVNGFNYTAYYEDREVEDIYIPLLKRLTDESRKVDGRYVVFLGAPPGTGKSTLSLMLEKLSRRSSELEEIQAVAMDGFHHYNEYLKSNYGEIDGEETLLYKRKGAPETFDLEGLKRYVKGLKEGQDIKWPIYDRQLHNPVMDVIDIESKIVLIEGNWLLLDEEGWKELIGGCDYSIFIEAKEEYLKNRLVFRKMRGGLSREEATEFYHRSDSLNVRRVLKNRLRADLELEMLETGENTIKREEERCL